MKYFWCGFTTYGILTGNGIVFVIGLLILLAFYAKDSDNDGA